MAARDHRLHGHGGCRREGGRSRGRKEVGAAATEEAAPRPRGSSSPRTVRADRRGERPADEAVWGRGTGGCRCRRGHGTARTPPQIRLRGRLWGMLLLVKADGGGRGKRSRRCARGRYRGRGLVIPRLHGNVGGSRGCGATSAKAILVSAECGERGKRSHLGRGRYGGTHQGGAWGGFASAEVVLVSVECGERVRRLCVGSGRYRGRYKGRYPGWIRWAEVRVGHCTKSDAWVKRGEDLTLRGGGGGSFLPYFIRCNVGYSKYTCIG